MSCPPEIAEIIQQILGVGLLRIRQLGWSGDGRRCGNEADHLHNLPNLLSNYSPDLLKFYLEVERPSFLSKCKPTEVASFEPLWNRLTSLYQMEAEQVSSS